MKLELITGRDGTGVYASANVTEATARKVDRAEETGARIIINTNWRFKGHGFARVEKLAQTNNRKSGRPKHIVWACWE